jgi:hypothetical protein
MADNELAHQRQSVQRMRERWPAFFGARRGHLAAHASGRTPSEKVAENILLELFTTVLDWTTEQVRLQEDRVDMLLTRLGVKYLVVEAKRPGSLDGPGSVGAALRQASGYAEALKVDRIAVSDGCVLEAYDLTSTGLRPRVRAHLSASEPAEDLWWLSVRGIYRSPGDAASAVRPPADESLLHPRYALPARCFAYVGHADKPGTWKLPYLRIDGDVDERRLPKAIQAVLQDYRGESVRLPEEHVPDVLVRLAHAAARTGRLPHQDPTPAPIYLALRDALAQFGRHPDGFGLSPAP